MPMILIAFILGILHAFDADHVAAVTAFVKKSSNTRSAQLVGLKWGFGHALSILVVGVVILVLKLTIPLSFTNSMEFIVGVVLVALGASIIKDLVKNKAHRHHHEHSQIAHTHFHSHKFNLFHQHGHAATLTGALHGLAGTASILVLMPITLLASLELAVLYVVIFSLGTILAMTCYTVCLSKIFDSLIANVRHAATGLIGTFNIGLGIYFVLKVIL